jgi:hypothetical protein
MSVETEAEAEHGRLGKGAELKAWGLVRRSGRPGEWAEMKAWGAVGRSV